MSKQVTLHFHYYSPSYSTYSCSLHHYHHHQSSSSECEEVTLCDFSFPSFNNISCNSGLVCMGAVISGEGFLKLTAGPQANNTSMMPVEKTDLNKVGRVIYVKQVQAWFVSFCTSFCLRIFPHLSTPYASDGIAFVMAQDNHSSAPLSYCSYLSLHDVKITGDDFYNARPVSSCKQSLRMASRIMDWLHKSLQAFSNVLRPNP